MPSTDPPDIDIGFDDFDETERGGAEARLLITQAGDTVYVKLRASVALEQSVSSQWFNGNVPEARTLFEVDYSHGTISIFPQVAYFSDRLYRQKYRRIREIRLPFNGNTPAPTDQAGAMAVLEELPSGFIKRPEFGLGVIMEMRPLILAIERIKDVKCIVIGENETTRVEGSQFYLNDGAFAQLRINMSRITRRYQAESLRDREILAHNPSLHRAKPDEYGFKERPYEPGMIYKLLGGMQSGKITLRGKDRVSILAAIKANAAAIAARDPKEFVQLQKDIELVGLDRLISSFQSRLRQNSRESDWQTLLELNPFILSMLFGQPIIMLQAGASVGGQTITGSGTKISDFLGKNPLTHNAALVELKTPNAPLFGEEYRSGVFSPSRALMGSIVQVLDQRLKLVTDIAGIKHRSRLTELEVFSVECVVVIGRTPSDDAKRSSFEIIRNQMKDVRVITFDELLERLQILRELLAGERYISDVEVKNAARDDSYSGVDAVE
jgi:hypothetical protein